MELFSDIFKITMIVAIAIFAVVCIVSETVALREQNQTKDGDTE